MEIDLTAVIFGGLVIVGVTVVVVVVIQQIFAKGRTGISAENRDKYKQLAERSNDVLEKTAAELERTVSEIAALRTRVGEVERLLKEVG